MKAWKFNNPVKLLFSDDFAASLDELLPGHPYRKIMLISYDWFQNTKEYLQLKEKIGPFEGYFDIEENPSVGSCQRAIDHLFEMDPDVIIAIGGGSVIDTAKILRAALYKDCRKVRSLFEACSTKRDKTLFLALPTTHGTGSEVTQWATVWDKEKNRKYSFSEYDNYPDWAVYDMRLMKNMPMPVALSSTMDSLSHAFEAIWNKNRNPVSTRFALSAVEMIVGNLNGLSEPVPPSIRLQLMEASMYSGLAFSNTKTAAAHSISYPLSLIYKIPHGIACSMPLFPLMKINEPEIRGEMEWLFARLNVRSVKELQDKVIQGVKGKIPFSLIEFGVKREELHQIVEQSFTRGRMDNNIIDLDRDDVLHILEDIYENGNTN